MPSIITYGMVVIISNIASVNTADQAARSHPTPVENLAIHLFAICADPDAH